MHTHRTINSQDRSVRSPLLLFLVIAVFVWITKYHPFLDVPYVFDAEARQHVYWTYTFDVHTFIFASLALLCSCQSIVLQS
jgi:hypothetical protein